MRERTFYPHKCPHCNKTFEASGKPVPGMTIYCKQCTQLLMKIKTLERKLQQDASLIQKEDAEIAEQINNLLVRENISEKDQQIVTALTKKLKVDEKRRKKILKEIKKLQKEEK